MIRDLEKRIKTLENDAKNLKVSYGTIGSNVKIYQLSRTFQINVSVPPATSSGPSVSTIKVRFSPSIDVSDYIITNLSANVQRTSGVSLTYWGSHQVAQNAGGVSEIEIPFINYDISGSVTAAYTITIFATSTAPGTLSLVE